MANPVSKKIRLSRDYINKRLSRRWLLRQLPKEGVGLEIGVHLGEFSQILQSGLQPRTLHLVDPWIYFEDDVYQKSFYGGKQSQGQLEMDERFESVCNRFRSEIDRGTVVIHRGMSESLVDQFDDCYFDWVYIDGNHLFDFVMKDLELYAPKVKVQGFIAGDDYGIKGWWDDGVSRAVDEFVAAGHAKFIDARHGQFLLQRHDDSEASSMKSQLTVERGRDFV